MSLGPPDCRPLLVVMAMQSACAATPAPPLPTRDHLPESTVASPVTPDTGTIEPVEATDLWTAADVEASLTTLLGSDVPNGNDFIGLFRALTSEGDSRCPGDDLAFTTPESSCTSSTGWEYFGFASYLDDIEVRDGTDVHIVAIPQASFVITAPDGRTFSAGGGFVHEQDLDSEGAWTQEFAGTFIWTGDGYPWMKAGTQLGWSIQGTRPTSGSTIRVHGPIAVGTNWVFVDTLDWDENRCDGVPEAVLRIRDDLGRWYDWSAGQDCGTCGAVTFSDASGTDHALGDVCLDLSDTMRFIDEANHFPAAG